jgi:hypothetical protein
MAIGKPKTRAATVKTARSSRHKKRRVKRTQPRQRSQRQPQIPQPENEQERRGMFESMMHFLGCDIKKENELLRMLQSTQPGLWRKIINKEKVEPGDLSDDVVRGVNQIIYERDTAQDIDIQVPQHVLSTRMREFNDKYISKLSEFHFEQLHGLIRVSVPSLGRFQDNDTKLLPPSILPKEVQIMVFRYLQRHLPEEIRAEIPQEEQEEQEDEAGGGEGAEEMEVVGAEQYAGSFGEDVSDEDELEEEEVVSDEDELDEEEARRLADEIEEGGCGFLPMEL